MNIPTEASVLRGQSWAYAAAILGGTISIIANIAHSFVPPPGAPDTWRPELGAVISSAIWPILLFFAVEVLARVKWFPGFWWGALRFGGMLSVAAGAFIVSWQHMYSLLRHYGEGPLVSFLGPIAVDGLMVMATAALLVIGIRKNRTIADQPLWETTSPVAHSDTDSGPQQFASAILTPLPAHLVSTARFAVDNHLSTTGDQITANELAARMNIDPGLAQRILDAIEHTHAPVLNGTVSGGQFRDHKGIEAGQ